MNYSKYRFFLPIICFLSLGGFTLNAQELSLENGTVNYKKVSSEAVVVTMAPDAKAVKEAWENYIEDKYDFKVKGTGFLTNKDVLYSEKVSLPIISDKRLNLYSKIVKKGDLTQMSVFSSLGYDIYINRDKNPAEYKAMRSLVFDFLDTYLNQYYQEMITVADEQFVDLNKDKEDKKEKIKKNEKNIEELQKENKELTKELAKLNDNLQDAEQKVDKRNNKLEVVRAKLAAYKDN